jgi:hypothetical protein
MSLTARPGSPRAGAAGAARQRCLPSSTPSSKPSSCATGPAPGTPRKCTPLAPAVCLTTLPPRCCVMVVKQSSGAVEDQWGEPGAGTAGVQHCGSGGEDRTNKTTTTTAKPEADNRGFRLGECAGSRNVIASRSVNASRSVPARSSLKPKPAGGANVAWLGVRRVAQCDRFAIGERFAFCASAIVAAPRPTGATGGGWLGVRRVAQCDRFAIGERFAFCASAIVAAPRPTGATGGGWLGVRRVAQGDRFAIDARCACCAGANAAGGDDGGGRR